MLYKLPVIKTSFAITAATIDVKPTPAAISKTEEFLNNDGLCNIKSDRNNAPLHTCSPTKSNVVEL